MIRRIRGRTAFQRLARDGKRIRRHGLWCSWCPDSPSTTTSVAFALGRALGPAVTRNRLRRRLRALCREADANHELPGGMLLLGARPAAVELTFDQLRSELRSMLQSITATSVAVPTSGSSAADPMRPAESRA